MDGRADDRNGFSSFAPEKRGLETFYASSLIPLSDFCCAAFSGAADFFSREKSDQPGQTGPRAVIEPP